MRCLIKGRYKFAFSCCNHKLPKPRLSSIIFILNAQFLARLHEVQKSYCSHPGRTRSRSRYRYRYRSRSRHTLLKFSRSLYLDNQLSESIHTWSVESVVRSSLEFSKILLELLCVALKHSDRVLYMDIYY